MSNRLRIAVINHVHPSSKHVSALRMRAFADVLAARGDQVLLLSEKNAADAAGTDAGALSDMIRAHDWSTPLFISAAPTGHAMQARAREGRLPGGIRQAVVAWSYLSSGGMFTDWRAGAAPLLPVIAETFKPDIVLATFGNTDAWLIAQTLARQAGCPWIGDMKDNWSAFIPPGFRARTARRFDDMAHMTVYSQSHETEAGKWFAQDKTVIYSGYDRGHAAQPDHPADDRGRIVLSGSLYNDRDVRILCDGVRRFCEGLPDRERISLVYAGNDGARFMRAADGLDGICDIENRGYLDADALDALQSRAFVNVYVANPRSLFQQKVLELLAQPSPVIAIPGEGDEALRIAAEIGNPLLCCADGDAVAAALDAAAAAAGGDPVRHDGIDAYSWHTQGERLREVMMHVTGANR